MAQKQKTYTLNDKAFSFAKQLIKNGDVIADQRDDWSEHAPSADDENDFINKHGWAEYAKWHLGIDEGENEETKARYRFPYGDFNKVHRCGVISAEGRAAQYGHQEIKRAAAKLLELIDASKT